MDVLIKDLVYSLRMLLKRPGLTLVALIAMALGANRSDVLRLVVRQGLIMTLIGLALGLVGVFVVACVAEFTLRSDTDRSTYLRRRVDSVNNCGLAGVFDPGTSRDVRRSIVALRTE
jgi:hypothetical protein